MIFLLINSKISTERQLFLQTAAISQKSPIIPKLMRQKRYLVESLASDMRAIWGLRTQRTTTSFDIFLPLAKVY